MNGSDMQPANAALGTGFRPSTMTEVLQRRRDSLAEELANVEAALTAITANPEVQTALDAIAKVGSGLRI